jgi:cytoskeletal protein CcmA (bactofilin family)
MFNKNLSEGVVIDKKDIETIIGASVKVEGNFICDGNIIIDGQVKGNVQTNGFLQIGRSANVIADVKAANARIGGEVRGSVKIEGYLEINDSAKIYGDIEAASLSIARGAHISGHCNTNESSPANSKKKSEPKEVVND